MTVHAATCLSCGLVERVTWELLQCGSYASHEKLTSIKDDVGTGHEAASARLARHHDSDKLSELFRRSEPGPISR